jgi:hypothetical protein
MSESRKPAWCPADELPVLVWQKSFPRVALELHVLTLKTGAVAQQIKVLTEPPCSAWFTEEEVRQLSALWQEVRELYSAAERWEAAWRARLESSQKS